jgi:hypothetical protein
MSETISVGGLTMSVPCDALDEALAAAQVEMKPAEKTSENPHFHSSFACLGEIIEATRVLARHGIALTQHPYDLDGRLGLTTMLKFKGQFIASTLSMKPQQDTPQADGSCLTYLKRYTAAAVCGLAIADDTDDDGNGATANSNQTPQREAAQRRARTPAKTNGTPKPSPAQTTQKLGDHFAGSPTYIKAKAVITSGKGADHWASCREKLLAAAEADRINVEEANELEAMIAKLEAEERAAADPNAKRLPDEQGNFVAASPAGV